MIPYAFARANGVVAVDRRPSGITVYARPDFSAAALNEIARTFDDNVAVTSVPTEEFETLVNRAYQSGLEQAREVAEDIGENDDVGELARSLPVSAELLETQNDAPVIRLINALLAQALREKVSDIHIEPFETRLAVRFRLDGMLRDVIDLRPALHGVVVSRIKVMAQLDIAEKRLPQDGRFSLRLAGRAVDVRVSTLLTGHGERVVMRLLDKQAGQLTMDSLGLPADMLASLRHLLKQPHGIILVTGPTGSGKTTTLYAALSELDSRQKNILTVEDPIEYALEGVGQTQINLKTNLTFARALRAILRQDPDIVMIGEIRDLETAQIAVQASLTGHLVLATLHTNDAVGVLTRLQDMGLEPFLVASSLLGVVAQRLVRRLCPDCRRPSVPSLAEAQLAEIPPTNRESSLIYSPVGCRACNNTGYRGRTGVYQTLLIDEDMRPLIHDAAGENALRQHASAGSLRSLRQDGMRWVRAGVTGIDEILRVTSE